MTVLEQATVIINRRKLALTLASRPQGVTIRQLADHAHLGWTAARNLLTDLEREGRLRHNRAEVRKVQSPGQPAYVFYIDTNKAA